MKFVPPEASPDCVLLTCSCVLALFYNIPQPSDSDFPVIRTSVGPGPGIGIRLEITRGTVIKGDRFPGGMITFMLVIGSRAR